MQITVRTQKVDGGEERKTRAAIYGTRGSHSSSLTGTFPLIMALSKSLLRAIKSVASYMSSSSRPFNGAFYLPDIAVSRSLFARFL